MKLKIILVCLLHAFFACGGENKTPKSDSIVIHAKQKTLQITAGTYLCWLRDFSSPGGRRLLGEIIVSGNSYSGDLYGKGKYSFTPSTKMVKFDGGGFDQQKKGKEWIGIFYKKGEKFIDGSGGTAINTMLIITMLDDWNKGYKKAWIQQCDLK